MEEIYKVNEHFTTHIKFFDKVMLTEKEFALTWNLEIKLDRLTKKYTFVGIFFCE